MKISLLITLGLFSLTSCGHFMKLPGPQFSTPEAQGAGSGKIENYFTQSYKVKPSPDFRDTPVSHRGNLERSGLMGLANSLGITDWLDSDLSVGGGQPLMMGLKVQWLGDPRNAAKSGNFSIATKFAYGLGVAGGEVTEEHNSPQAREWTVDAGVPHYEAMFGYRFIDPLLVWLSYYRENYSYVTDFIGGIADRIRHSGKQTGINFGLGFNTEFLVTKFVVAKVKHKLKTQEPTEADSIQFALTFGFLW